MIDYSELKRLAEADHQGNTKFIIGVNGLTEIRALLAENEELKAKHAECAEFIDQASLDAEDFESLRKDAERYRWMRANFVRNHKHSLVWYLPIMTPLTAEGLDENLDDAIARQ